MSKVRGVVVLVADQLRADHLGFGGGQVPTPHLDALAASGTVFDQAYVANPTCMPNRATIATGRGRSSWIACITWRRRSSFRC